MQKKRYALVGTGSRSQMYIGAITNLYADRAELVALCDTNPKRMEYYNNVFLKQNCGGHPPVPAYHATEFDRMIAECKPDTVIITSMDRTHHLYGCRAMELGCDVISEKPMTIDTEKCQQIIDTQKRTGRNYRVTFNYRYSPRNTKVKEILASGKVGEITTIHFEWLLDTCHGADYFRRWHRNKANSGGLLVHKATHHFDLVNWWIDSIPRNVFAMGDLKFYGRINAEKRGITRFYDRARGSELAKKDPFALRVGPSDRQIISLYYDAENEDGYYRDRNVFSDGIDIEDNMSVMVRYRNNAVMTYNLCAHCPWEGYRIVFNGTKGRLEFNVLENPVCDPKIEDFNLFGNRERTLETAKPPVPEIVFQPHWGLPELIGYEDATKEGHGGGDRKMLDDIFIGGMEDPLGHAADFHAGANSILTGIAANLSIKTGNPVDVSTLIHW